MNRFKEARTQIKKVSVETVARETGLATSLINDLEYTGNKQRDVGYRKIATLAQYYGVSIDYLAGISDCATLDTTIQSVCVATGLSEEATKKLIGLKEVNENDAPKELIAFNKFMESKHIYDFMSWLNCYIHPEDDILYHAQLQVYENMHLDKADPVIIARAVEASRRDSMYMIQSTVQKIMEHIKDGETNGK